MDLSNASSLTETINHRRRSITSRLWESYAIDLIDILELANNGKIQQRIAHEAMEEIIPSMKMLRDGGDFESMLKKADLVILDKVFNDVAE